MFVEKEETGSTNDDARALALAGAPAGSAVLARRQTQGRGRAGRSFASPPGGMYLSVVLRPRLPPARWGILSLAAALDVALALRARGFPVEVKWPNDLFLDRAKLGGILAEARLDRDGFVVVGIGLNLDAAPPDIAGATSLAAHRPPPAARALAEDIAARLMARAEALEREGAAPTLAALRPICSTLGKKVEWEKGEGVAVDVAEDGALVVERADGARERVVAGDVRVRQRA